MHMTKNYKKSRICSDVLDLCVTMTIITLIL